MVITGCDSQLSNWNNSSSTAPPGLKVGTRSHEAVGDIALLGLSKKAIHDEFAPRPPAHWIYQMIFEMKQNANAPTGLFIAHQKHTLLAQIMSPDSASRQLDFLYGLLRQDIKDKIPRTRIATFCELLTEHAT